ncbi:unnamed protein product, partial [Ascophyllum nodosum]
ACADLGSGSLVEQASPWSQPSLTYIRWWTTRWSGSPRE